MKKLVFIFLTVLTFNLYSYFGWEDPVLISYDKNFNQYPSLYISKNLTAITWINSISEAQNFLAFRLSKDSCKTYNEIKIVDSLKSKKFNKPSIAIYNNTILISACNEENNILLYYLNLNETNTNFTKIPLLTSTNMLLLPNFLIYSNEIYLFYQENYQNKKFRINFIKSSNNYLNWSKPQTIIEYYQQPIGSFFPVIKIFNNKIYCIWSDRTGKENLRNDVIYLKYYSPDSGWSKIFQLSSTNEDAIFPNFVVKENKLYLVYYSRKFQENQFKTSLKSKIFDIQQNWNLISENQIDFAFAEYYQIELFFHKELFHLIWYTYRGKNCDIYYSISEDFLNWTEPERITETGKNWNIKLFYTEKYNYLVYQKDLKNKSLIYLARSDETCLPPEVFSPSHKTNQWSYENSVTIKWKTPSDISGIKAYAYKIDQFPDTIPDIENLSAEIEGKTFEQLPNGIHYFHIRAIDKLNNLSETVHYKIMINTNPPEPPIIYSDTHKEIIPTSDNSPHFYWTMKDNRPVKGYSFLLTQEKNLEPDNVIDTTKTDMQFKNLEPGVWYFMLKACDPKNRWSDNAIYTITIQEVVLATGLPENIKSRYFYKVKEGDVLDKILEDVLYTKEFAEQRIYEKDVGEFNYMQNLDFIKPEDLIMFPIVIAEPGDTKESLAIKYFGTPKQKDKIIPVEKDINSELVAGDKIIIKDKYFLRTGEIKGTQSTNVLKKENIK